MKEIQKFIEAIFALIVGITLFNALPIEMRALGLSLLGLVLAAVVILGIFWFFKNFLEDYI